MESVLPSLSESGGLIDGKASRRSRKAGQQPLLLVSSFAREARLILGQEACAEESNEWTAIPILLESLMLKGGIYKRRILAASFDQYHAKILGLTGI